jgi:hypothetical protein
MSAKLPEKAKHQPPSPSPSGGGFFKKIVEKLGRPASQEELCNPPPSDEIRCYTSADIYRLIAEQRAKHGLANVMPNIYSISQILRVAGDWLDRKKINAFDVSFYGQTLCIGYESAVGEEIRESLDIRNLYDLAIQMYLRRTKR